MLTQNSYDKVSDCRWQHIFGSHLKDARSGRVRHRKQTREVEVVSEHDVVVLPSPSQYFEV